MGTGADDRRYWVVDAHINGQLLFLGRCLATLAEVRRDLGPWCEITGNHVVIYHPPPKSSPEEEES